MYGGWVGSRYMHELLLAGVLFYAHSRTTTVDQGGLGTALKVAPLPRITNAVPYRGNR